MQGCPSFEAALDSSTANTGFTWAGVEVQAHLAARSGGCRTGGDANSKMPMSLPCLAFIVSILSWS